MKRGMEYMTENKRFRYNVNENTIEQGGKFVAYMNCVDGVRVANKLNVLQEENENIKHTIQTMLKNERTHIGRNTLQQLWEAIQ